MNIYSFVSQEKFNNVNFIDNMLKKINIPYHVSFRNKLLVLIEASVKGKLSHIIQFEKEVAITAELCHNEVDFIDGVSNDPEWQEYFFEEYPVVEEYLSSHYTKINYLIETVLTRLNKDFSELGLPSNIELENFNIGEGDFHDGKCTCKLSFSNGILLYYKPRSLAIDIEMLNFFLKFQDLINKKYFYPVINIDKGVYGWSKAVEISNCKLEEQVKNYYEGLGVFTALAHALKIEDIIFDNLLSTNGVIALIDLECSFCTKTPFDKKVSYMFNSKAGDLYRDSLIHTGIIPSALIHKRHYYFFTFRFPSKWLSHTLVVINNKVDYFLF